MAETRIKIHLVDDHKIFVQGIANLLANEKNIEVIGTSYDGKSVLASFKDKMPDVLLTDISMSGMSGIELAKTVKELYPEVKVIGLSMSDKQEIIKELIDSGADGYLLKDLEKNELMRAITEVYEGKTFYSGTVAELMTKGMENKDFLTKREREIISLIAKEKSNVQIAEMLFISEHTVESHRKNIFRKTKSKSLVGLINYAHDNKLV
jgi:two-component system nitrate/nitrite response regulator NarL